MRRGALDLEADHDAEQRGAFNERGENERGGLDTTRSFWLTRHALNGRTTDAANAHAGADHGTTGRNAGADHSKALRILNNGRDCLEETHDFHRNTPKIIVEKCTPDSGIRYRASRQRAEAQRESPIARSATSLEGGGRNRHESPHTF